MAAATNISTEKKYAVVTGANKGIGLEICVELASKGIVVVLTARDNKRGLDGLEKLRSLGYSDDVVLFHQLDVADPSSLASLVGFIHTKFGKLDILVNNAGIGGAKIDVDALRASAAERGGVPDFAKCLTQSYDSAVECLQINYHGAKKMVEAFAPLLQKSRSPRIVNVSSSLGKLELVYNEWAKGILGDANNLSEERVDEVINAYLQDLKEDTLEAKGWTESFPAYNVSKAALNAYTRIVAKKYPSFKVNCVCPGYVKTDINFNTGILSVEEGAASPVRLALLPDDGPSGLFFYRDSVSSF